MSQKIYRFSAHAQSLADTQAIARRLSQTLLPGDVLGLSGELGAGKTEFVRELVLSLGFSGEVTSASFVLENVYDIKSTNVRDGISKVSHWDLYRVPQGPLAAFLDLSETAQRKDAVTVIEWPERIFDARDLLSVLIVIKFRDDKESSGRDFAAFAFNDRGAKILTEAQFRHAGEASAK